MSLSFLDDSEYLKKLKIIDWGYTEDLNAASFPQFQAWLNRHDEGILHYLTGERAEKRQSLQNYWPSCQSALSFCFSYIEAKKFLEVNNPDLKIAAYVHGFQGLDYHLVLRDYLNEIAKKLRESYPEMEIKLSLDTQPILERDLAFRVGLGWVGKNSMLISRTQGSFFILGSLLLSQKLPLQVKIQETDHCGTCRACIEVCPTEAIDEENRTIIANKCISTFTIEQFKETEPPLGYEKGTGEIFGCDLCQDVCPWNKKILQTSVADRSIEHSKIHTFFGRPTDVILSSLEELSNNQFRQFFKNTPLERTGRIGLLKNLKAYLKAFSAK